jgi:fatty acid desaturase
VPLSSHQPRRSLFAHPEDRHCVLYHAVTLCAYGLAFALWLNPGWSGLDSALDRLLFCAAAVPMLGWIGAIDLGVNYHNHSHRPVFRSAALNRWISRSWGLTSGWSAPLWRHLHVQVHHREFLGPKDWSVARRRPDGRFESRLSFQLLHWPWRTAYHMVADFRAGRLDRRQALVELAWFAALWSIPFWIDPWMGLCLWVAPHCFANWVTLGCGMYVQHDGCHAFPADPTAQHSNEFHAPLYNWTMFNIGYHAQHHDFPGRHWSELPTGSCRQPGRTAEPQPAESQPAEPQAAEPQQPVLEPASAGAERAD